MTGNRHEAQDMAQESFLRAYANLKSYDEKRNFQLGYFVLPQIYVLSACEKGLTYYSQIAPLKE